MSFEIEGEPVVWPEASAEPDAYSGRRRVLIDYLRMKVGMEDWHGVADAANDLRELDAEWRGRQERLLGS